MLRTQSCQERTEESPGLQSKEAELSQLPSYMNYNKVEKVGVPVAKTVDTKCFTMGTSVQTQNGVVECKRLNK